MPTTIYKSSAGRRLPSVTTVIGQWGSAEGLIRWAANLGLDGIDAIAERSRLAKVGTLVHDVCAQMLLGVDLDEALAEVSPEVASDSLSQFNSCVAGWVKALSECDIGTPLLVEEHMVSDKYQYGGTPDAILLLSEDEMCVMDVKTGYVGEGVAMQLAAYRRLYEADAGLSDLTCSGLVIQLNRDDGGYCLHRLSSEALDLGWEMFLECLKLYNNSKQMRKMMRGK